MRIRVDGRLLDASTDDSGLHRDSYNKTFRLEEQTVHCADHKSTQTEAQLRARRDRKYSRNYCQKQPQVRQKLTRLVLTVDLCPLSTLQMCVEEAGERRDCSVETIQALGWTVGVNL